MLHVQGRAISPLITPLLTPIVIPHFTGIQLPGHFVVLMMLAKDNAHFLWYWQVDSVKEGYPGDVAGGSDKFIAAWSCLYLRGR